ncbi:MAG: matrixin family metalloprotease [Acidothermaceae bacterium]
MTSLFRQFFRLFRHSTSNPVTALVAFSAALMLSCVACDTSSSHSVGATRQTSAPTAASVPSVTPATSPPAPSSTVSVVASPSLSPHATTTPGSSQRSTRTRRASATPAATSRPPTHPPAPPTSSAGPGSAPVSSPPPLAPSMSASPAKAGSAYTVFTNSNNTVVRWNPCAPIHYAVNVAAASDPSGATRDVQAAISRVASATGLTFVFDGETSVVPTKAWLDAGNQAASGSTALVIAWASAGSGSGQSDLFGNDADGEGGWWESGTSADGTHWVWQIKRGFVVIDPSGVRGYASGFGIGETRGDLLMHELGHAVGLGHAADQDEVMFPVISSSSTATWGAGDLAGLARVGKAAGCIS